MEKALLETSPDCVKILDLDGRLQFMNINGQCLMEIEDFKALEGNYWWDLWGEENRSLVRQSVERALQGEPNEFVAFCPTAKGTPKWWSVLVTPYRDSEDHIVDIISASRDITREKHYEMQLERLNASLEEKVKHRTQELMDKNRALQFLNEELSTFNFVASHDMQEPLRKIQMLSSKALNEEGLSDNIATVLSKVAGWAQQMQSLLQEFLNFLRLSSDDIPFYACGLDEIMQGVVSDLQHVWSPLKASIEILPLPVVQGQRVLFHQLFSHLIGNALKFASPDRTLHIRISASVLKGSDISQAAAHAQREYHCIVVQDNGLGFDSAYADKIFHMFEKLQDGGSGMGIGLTVCKKIVHLLGGFIAASSSPGDGTAFRVYLPIA